ncbi:enolase C-terminal domain-like protein [Vulgatibacter incomptus]|uniref:Putative racemase n=1 Tax=Vulgatibacter incomptus TaxID=1391653 RepID=A0A0K1P9P6_9BACT|nr:enolase C-terminal domain-like protein [Vulgatibacter incomptus]AKU90235.1 putative racemase [Vulgatibacter incomptus]
MTAGEPREPDASKRRGDPTIDRLEVSAYRIPTDQPESDGTLAWDSTTLVLVEVEGGGRRGLGYSYTSQVAAGLIRSFLAPLVLGQSAMEPSRIGYRLFDSVRNMGQHGVTAHAISAVDVALWDLEARLLSLPLATLLGKARSSVPIYGSGGFTSYSEQRLVEQLGGWVNEGMAAVKMKIGRDPGADPHRIRTTRREIGDDVELYVDANGALHPREAVELAGDLAESSVSWFEEPVSSEDRHGLRFVRDHAPAGVRIVAGEYSSRPIDSLRLLEDHAVDVLQADATRCGGITGFLRAGALCEAFQVPLSSHCAPSIHAHACCAVTCAIEPLEYFHDHVRIEHLVFDGALKPSGGELRPDDRAPGLGLSPRRGELEKYRIE